MNNFKQGFVETLPVAASVAAYGGVLGVLAVGKGFGWGGMLLMNLAVFAGSAQFVMVEMWGPVLPVFQIALAAAVINLRYLLIGASLRESFSASPLWIKLTIIHLVADENWAVTMAARPGAERAPAFLLGGGVCVMSFWCAGTLAGVLFGGLVDDPKAWALDFAFTAVFTALAVGLYKGKRDLLPWLAAGLAAVIAEKFLPGKWYVLAGGAAGAMAAFLLPEPAGEREGHAD